MSPIHTTTRPGCKAPAKLKIIFSYECRSGIIIRLPCIGGEPPEFHDISDNLNMPAILAHKGFCLNVPGLKREKLGSLRSK